MSSKNETIDTIKDEAANDIIEEAKEEVKEEKDKSGFKPDFKNLFVLLLDYWFITGSYILALFFLSELDFYLFTFTYLSPVISITPFYALGTIVLNYIAGLYPDDYDMVSVRESRRLLFVTAISVVGYSILMRYMAPEPYPHIFYIMGGMIQFFLSLSIRYFKRIISPSGK